MKLTINLVELTPYWKYFQIFKQIEEIDRETQWIIDVWKSSWIILKNEFISWKSFVRINLTLDYLRLKKSIRRPTSIWLVKGIDSLAPSVRLSTIISLFKVKSVVLTDTGQSGFWRPVDFSRANFFAPELSDRLVRLTIRLTSIET